jgi:Ohr subfamily peroxiredoxin
MKILYTAQALATGEGRDGRARSADGKLDVLLASPPELGGDGNGTNPEQLFAAGYAACFHSAMRVAGRRQKADLTGSTVNAKVDFGSNGQGGYGIGVRMDIRTPQLDPAQARAIIESAHQICPYSNATRGNISVELTLLGADAVTEATA